ncbi:MAG: hypothetical protein B6U89_06160 [Desulfurococcales archaeon ex4484_58]|nr:MAG: hypothetical protein B6U89_06160 [Desulfurococcales archaeon ex4484_58]
MKISIDEFKKKYPNLAREILDGEGLSIKISIDDKPPDPWRGYLPKPTDYIRRCKNIEEALEVIDYLEKRGEITREAANEYRRLLNEFGLEYFGPRKEDDYYYKKAYEYWRKLTRKKKNH